MEMSLTLRNYSNASNEKFFETDVVVINYGSMPPIVFLRWLAQPNSKQFRTALDKLLRALFTFRTGNVVMDVTHLGYVAANDLRWQNAEWFPKARQAGCHKVAIIVSSAAFSELSVDDTMAYIKNNVMLQHFDVTERGIDWLTEHP